MNVFLDTSALVKRYFLKEQGSAWVVDLCDPTQDHLLFIAQITVVEFASVLYRKTKAGVGFRTREADRLIALFGRQIQYGQYQQVPLNDLLLQSAFNLARTHKLKTLDAIQLACALVVRDAAVAGETGQVLFVSADRELLTAAAAEALSTENPEAH